MLKRILILTALAIFTSPLVFSQITTSAINGSVKGPGDDPLVGATITATHLPSGTKYATSTRGGGVFQIANMKVGGPYLIEVSFVGYKTERFDDVYLQLAESFVLTPTLTKTDATLENVIVSTGRRSQTFNPNRTGAVTNVNIRQITQLPSISRSINDYTRATPQSNGVSIGGGNYRQNNFTVDGADFNNTFGISTGAGNLPAGGSPISIDAIEEISVNITPFDVRQSGFIGAGINAVTRSGTNTFTGSVYKYFRNERHRGRKVEKTYFVRPPEQFEQKGVRIGGPIIKNKLFFFLSWEKDATPVTLVSNFAATPAAPYGSAANIARPTADSLNIISNYLLTKYGYITGRYDNYTVDKVAEKVMARIDWNINGKNRLNLRYSQVEGGSPSTPSTSFSGITTNNSAPSGGGRTALTALWFENSNYFQGINFYSFSGELNSNIGKFFNTARASYTYQNESRTSNSQVFPFVDILSSGGGVTSPAVYTSFGYEPFTYGNLRKVKTYSFTDNLKWTMGKHSWIAGAQVDLSSTVNGFQRAATSYYQFASWNDFVTGQKPIQFGYTYSLSKGFAQAFPSFKSTLYSVYLQDEITLNRNFRLTLGLRLDQTGYPDVPEIKTHPLILALNFNGGAKVNTGLLPDKKITWSPRLGFNWDLYGNRSLQIRGGTGIFAGRVPFVWIVSQSGDAGLLQVTQSFSGAAVPGPFNPDPRAYYPTTIPAAGVVIPTPIEVLDPNYKNPQTWKSSLAMDTKLPLGMIGSLEAIFNRDLVTPYFNSINLVNPTPLGVAGYPDNRMIYPSVASGTNYMQFINRLNAAGQASPTNTLPFNVYNITNGKRGYYFSITGKLEKPFSKGFFASVSYTKSIAGNLFDGAGDQPGSAWQSIQTVNGVNDPKLSYAGYVVPDRVVATVSYRREYFKHLATSLSFIYQGSVDFRFSYTYSTDFNRDGTINDLIYIPKDARNPAEIQFVATSAINGVVYSPAQQAQLFEYYINQDKYLRKHRGQYAERNGATAPWRNQVDARFMQDIFVKAGKNRNTLQFTIDAFNFGNLLNSSWGKQKTTNASAILVPANAPALVAGGTVVPTFRLNTSQNQIVTRTFRDIIDTRSTYSIQFGIRYLFN
jgi:hypothetical protein